MPPGYLCGIDLPFFQGLLTLLVADRVNRFQEDKCAASKRLTARVDLPIGR